MKSVGLILAKKGSKRLENKNFKEFLGKPMFVWNLERMLKIFNKVYVSSDYEFILETAKKMGAIAINRPDELCGDVPNIPVYQHALPFMDSPDIIVAVQANSPTIEESLIKKAKSIIENYGFNELMTCHKDYKIYGSIWAITVEKLKNYGDPFKPNPEVLLLDESIDIHTQEDFNSAIKQLN